MSGIDMDPTIVRSWPAIIAYWHHVRGPCARCGGPIHYDEPRYRMVTTRAGIRRRIENKWALDVGHKLGRDLDPRTVWAPVDTQPEHAYCNRRAGAIYGNVKRGWRRRVARASVLRTSRRW